MYPDHIRDAAAGAVSASQAIDAASRRHASAVSTAQGLIANARAAERAEQDARQVGTRGQYPQAAGGESECQRDRRYMPDVDHHDPSGNSRDLTAVSSTRGRSLLAAVPGSPVRGGRRLWGCDRGALIRR